MRNIRNRRVVKKTVGDLKKELKDIPDDTEIILAFYLKDKANVECYLGEISTNLKYDGVLKEKLYDSSVVELAGFDHAHCTYMERENGK